MRVKVIGHYLLRVKILKCVIFLLSIMQIGCGQKNGSDEAIDERPLVQAANLQIGDFQFTGSIAGPGQLQSYQFTVKNIGDAPAGEFLIGAQYGNPGMEPSDSPPGDRPSFGFIINGVTYQSPGLEENEAKEISANVRLALTGVTTITIHVDPDESIPESDESDNMHVVEIIIPAAG